MRDFINIEVVHAGVNTNSTLLFIRHKKRPNLEVEVNIPNNISPDMFGVLFVAALSKYSRKYSSLMQKPMTASQKDYYDKLVEFHKMEGRAPSYEEQCLMLNVKSKGTPHYFAKKLEQAGWIWFDGNSAIPYEIAEPDILDKDHVES